MPAAADPTPAAGDKCPQQLTVRSFRSQDANLGRIDYLDTLRERAQKDDEGRAHAGSMLFDGKPLNP
jgi:hypothetical protein